MTEARGSRSSCGKDEGEIGEKTERQRGGREQRHEEMGGEHGG